MKTEIIRTAVIAKITQFNDDFDREAFERLLEFVVPEGRTNFMGEYKPEACLWYHDPCSKGLGFCTTIFTSHRSTWRPEDVARYSPPTIMNVAHGEYMGEAGVFTLHKHSTTCKAPYEK